LHWIIDEHIADASAENDAKGRPEQRIIDLQRCDRGRALPQARRCDHLEDVAPAKRQASNIGQCIPANGQRPDLDEYRVNVGKGNAIHGGTLSGICEGKGHFVPSNAVPVWPRASRCQVWGSLTATLRWLEARASPG